MVPAAPGAALRGAASDGMPFALEFFDAIWNSTARISSEYVGVPSFFLYSRTSRVPSTTTSMPDLTNCMTFSALRPPQKLQVYQFGLSSAACLPRLLTAMLNETTLFSPTIRVFGSPPTWPPIRTFAKFKVVLLVQKDPLCMRWSRVRLSVSLSYRIAIGFVRTR